MNRILFPGNPWPAGHAILTFAWSGRMQPDGTLWFDLHLETDDYYAEDPGYWEREDEDDDSDWTSKGCWGNYHRCTISSTEWHDGGWEVGSPSSPLDWSSWSDRKVEVDSYGARIPQDQELEERAFHTYLMGHDAVANHRLHFRSQDSGGYRIDWQGNIALLYTGDHDLTHEFRAQLSNVAFQGFSPPNSLTTDEAVQRFASLVIDPPSWRWDSERRVINRI